MVWSVSSAGKSGSLKGMKRKIKKGRISYSRERARLSTVQLKCYGEYVGRH